MDSAEAVRVSLACLILLIATPAQADPLVAFVAPTNGEQILVGTAPTVTVEASDDEGIDMVRLFVDGNIFGTQRVPAYNWGSALAGLVVGEHELEAVAFNNVGQTTNNRIVITIVAVEVEPPPPEPEMCLVCTGIRTDRDMAIDAESVRMCIPDQLNPVHWEIQHDDGELNTIDACAAELLLFTDRRVRTRARFIEGMDYNEWSGWIRRLAPLETHFTCPGDFDLNGDVDGNDFVIFREHFRKGFCE